MNRSSEHLNVTGISLRLFIAHLILCWAGISHAREYVVPAGNVAHFFANLPADATYLSFSETGIYTSDRDIILPDVTFLVIDGRGSTLQLGPNSNGFTRNIVDQKDANRRTSSRYLIKDFAVIEGGRKGVDLKASLGSVISNCRFRGQSEAAIDLRFCLMTRIENVLVTNPAKQGIVVRHGDWPGATGTNSQSNSSVLDQCRVYCSRTTTNAFAVINTGGVRMVDCISEGEAADCDLYLTATLDGDESKRANNPVVKSFKLENFHIEHRLKKHSIYVNMPPKASVVLSNVYWNSPQKAPVILYVSGQLSLMDIGWWRSDLMIHSRISAPRINVIRCPSQLGIGNKLMRTKTTAGSFALVDPLPGNSELDLTYVRIVHGSY